MKHNKGFTLLELSIVLVIVGLLAAGVLAGKHLISTAAVRGTLVQVNKLDLAIHAFKNKYDSLPGDTKKAEMMAFGAPGGPGANGDGDGTIHSNPFMMLRNHAGEQQEVLNLFYHLKQAGLIQGEYKVYHGTPGMSDDLNGYMMKAPIGETAFIGAASVLPPDGGSYQMGSTMFIFGQRLNDDYPGTQYVMTAQQAYDMDIKLDDGFPETGKVRTLWPYSGPVVALGFNGCTMPDPATNTFHVYDTQGKWANYQLQIINPTPRPNQIGCAMAIQGSW